MWQKIATILALPAATLMMGAGPASAEVAYGDADSARLVVEVAGAESAEQMYFPINTSTPDLCVRTQTHNSDLTRVGIESKEYGGAVSEPLNSGEKFCFVFPKGNELREGSSKFEVQAIDAGGDVSSSSDIVINTDFKAPLLPAISDQSPIPDRWGNPADLELNFVSEPGVEWGYILDGGEYQSLPSGKVSLTQLADGFHTVWAVASDQAGNLAASVVGFGVGDEPVTACDTGQLSESELGKLSEELTQNFSLSKFVHDQVMCRPFQNAGKLRGPDYVAAQITSPTGSHFETTTLLTKAMAQSEDSDTAAESTALIADDSSLASGCKTDSRRSGSAGLYYFKTSVRFCYTGKKVNSVTTSRSWTNTTAGNAAGYRFDSYEDPTKFYYSLNGVADAAYRYTQMVYWSFGRPWSFQCNSTHTQRVYGSGRTTWAWNKHC